MAGRGPQPKDPSRRARRNAGPEPLRIIEAEAVGQPDLPEFEIGENKDGDPIMFRWNDRTRVWWQMWADSPLAADFTANDWSELLDCALIHCRFWNGDLKLAPELRLRVAKFGATPEDRARLRITFAQADEADGGKRASAPAVTAREQYAGLSLAE